MQVVRTWFWLLCANALFALLTATPALAEEGREGRLVNVAWLQRNLPDAVLLDASMTAQHRAGHIPGAVSADLYRYGAFEPSRAAMEARIPVLGRQPGTARSCSTTRVAT